MRNLVWGLLCFVLFYSCKKESGCGYSDQNIVAPVNEQQAVKDYLTSNNIQTALKDSSGFYYEILKVGDGNGVAGLCTQVELTYTGQLSNGNVFDQSTTAFTLGSSIEGMRKGLPYIKKGGHMKLYIPPTLAYGSNDIKDNSGKVIIPANSILIFDITLNSFY
ncbi:MULTISPECIES: FKBP-type peptidyl-prolyl cis-trans isomerase [Niastella]|uniref:Peptidyl-prolyl cis-trans isomerase n=1 Tax=Niastella soli TaxID=2821487 RepID=A0ABS3Z040_9BACT|nr:FKBP-type peptidyl-prolyl cis-trans isomerase [Niastella soli]MBO9203540.1 FKBP-type peptidyl-prolyl cis-trans isomerase [Niastella soli]